jgi:hypothetical protein
MKVVVPKSYDGGVRTPVLPLIVDETLDQPKNEDLRSFKLRTVPADANSAKYEAKIRIIHGDEHLRTVIKWTKDVQRVLTGLAIADIANKHTIVKELLRGTALTMYKSSREQFLISARNQSANTVYAATVGDAAAKKTAADVEMAKSLEDFDNDNCLKYALRGVIDRAAPKKAKLKIKRYLRREVRKPADMKVRDYYSNIIRMNNEELPELYPYDRALANDEIVDILLWGVPRSWIRQMDLQGKDPDEMTAVQVVQFFEQIEESEDFIPDSKSGNNKGNGKKSKSNGKDNNGKTKKVCMIHGECGHTTDECRTVQSKVNKRSRTNDDKDDKRPSKNKTWSRKADDNKKKAKNDLNAIIQEAVQKEVNALTEAGILKRKSDSESSDSEPDSDGEEMNCVEQRMKKVDIDAIDLNNFDLDELKEHAKSKMD